MIVFAAGCLGGFANSLVAGELKLPRRDAETETLRPGWIGTLLVGGIASLVVWGLYGPLSSANIVGGDAVSAASATLQVGELCGAVLTGVGGGRVLLTEVDKHSLRKEKASLVTTRDKLADAVSKLVERSER
jgi:hypothetical protein